MNITEKKQIIVLFNEFGTPTFNFQHNLDIFLGVSVLFELDTESQIYDLCDEEMGLSIKNALKNNRIGVSRAKQISKVIATQDLSISTRYLKLSNDEFKTIVLEYKKYGDLVRNKYREDVGDRSVSQILYDSVFNTSLFDVIANYLESKDKNHNCNFEIYIDDWSFPVDDKDKYINDLTKSLKNKMQEYIQEGINEDADISISKINILKGDLSKRARFVDVLTSIISRAFLDSNNKKYDLAPLNELNTRLQNNLEIEDLTIEMINFYNNMIPKLKESL